MNEDHHDNLARYHRQALLPDVGEQGQAHLQEACALVVGCGALGCTIIDHLARAGVGRLVIVDRDVVELTNLHRQTLFTEHDAEHGVPKAIAAAERVRAVNSSITVEPIVDDINAANVEALLDHDVNLILDGLDNFRGRYLLNDVAVKHGLPLIHGGAVGYHGTSLCILPASKDDLLPGAPTPCLRCVFPEPPAPGTTPTCDTAGVLGSVVTIIAAHQATQAIKLLLGRADAIDRHLLSIDAWTNTLRRVDVSGAGPGAQCPCCGRREFSFLDSTMPSSNTSLCGQDAVQILPPAPTTIDLSHLSDRLAPHGSFVVTPHLLRGEFSEHAVQITVFPNGRAIIKGTTRTEQARSLYDRYIGS